MSLDQRQYHSFRSNDIGEASRTGEDGEGLESPGGESFDILFKGVTVITGSEGDEPFVADVGVHNGLISSIDRSRYGPTTRTALNDLTASSEVYQEGSNGHTTLIDSRDNGDRGDGLRRVVLADGLVLCPGFIDLHAHSDLYLLTHPEHEPKLSQGVTTEVIGQDGISYAPTETAHQLSSIRTQIAGWNGNPTKDELEVLEEKGVDGLFAWGSLGEYLDVLERNGTATNVAVLVPQGNLRLIACGPYDTPATSSQIDRQKDLLRTSMREGAIGMSSGLTYTPGMYASTSEPGSLCEVLSEEFPGSYYAPHHRSYGHKALESYKEMLDLGERTRCPLHLTHATLNFAENRGKAPELLLMIDESLNRGLDVTLDTYPYLPGCTTLAALLPSWAAAGGPEETLRRLGSEMMREKIRVAMEITGCDGGHGVPTDWATIQVGTCTQEDIQLYSGKLISEIAQDIKCPPIQVYFDILRKEKLSTSCIMHIGNEENVRDIMLHSTHCGGTDAILHGDSIHPRAYGTFPRFIGNYARDLGLMTISQMIPHLTSRPAKRIGVYPKRGYVGIGSHADLVLFDPKTIRDMATFESPREKSRGVLMVLVNGKVSFEWGKVRGPRAGKVLRRRADGTVE